MFVKAVSPPSFFLLPSPFLNAFTAHICRLHTHINICFAHIECHCKSRGVKTTRRQSVGPAQQGATQPARNVAFDDEAEAPSKMKGSVSVSLSSHTVPLHQHPQGTYNGQNKNLQEAYQTLYQFFAHFVVLDSAPRREHPCPPPHSKMPIPPHLRVPTMTTKKHRKKQQHYQRAYQCLWLFKPLFALFLSTPLASPDLTPAADAAAA